MKKIILFIVALGIIFTSKVCGSESRSKEIQKKPILIKHEFPKVDSDKIIGFNHIIFSPITEKEIWGLNIDGISYKFCIRTRKWESLEPILGKFARGLSKDVRILRDHVDKNSAWIGNFRRGVLLYNINTGSKIIFDKETYFHNNEITNIQPDENCIWIGTTGGLYRYDRENKEITKIDGFDGVWIRSIEIEKDRLWINGEYIYYPEIKKITQIYKLENWPISKVISFKIVDGYKIFSSLVGNMVVIMDKNDKIIATLKEVPIVVAVSMDQEGNIWLYSGAGIAKFSLRENKLVEQFKNIGNVSNVYIRNNYLYFSTYQGFGKFNKSTGEVEIYPVAKANPDFIVDEEYFWILSQEGIIQISKVESEKLFVSILDIKQAREKILNLTRAIRNEKDIIERIKIAAEFFNFISITWNKNIPNLAQSEYFVRQKLRTREPKDIQRIKNFLNTNIKPLEKEIGYYILATSPLLIGDPVLSLHYYNIFKKKFPNSVFLTWIRKNDLQRLENACQEFKKIKSEDLPEDERLWRLGNLFFEAMQVEWNEVEVGYNYSYTFGLFKELIEKYPNSKWADNAEFKMLSYYEGLIHEGGEVTLSCVSEYEKFIRKYPNSELVPAAKLEIGDHYYEFVRSSYHGRQYMKFDEIRDYLNKAKTSYNDVINLYPNTQYAQKAVEKLKEVDDLLDKCSWVLELSIPKSIYFIGEDIIISFKLKNMRNVDRKINIYQNLPNFGISILRKETEYKRDKVPFIRDTTVSPSKKQKVVRVVSANGGYFFEEHKIQQLTINADTYPYEFGKFKLDKSGIYEVRGFYKEVDQNGVIISDEISFLIKEK